MAHEKFCLRWNDFESNISSAFRELRDDKDFFDVTLACDDDQIQAHKVILSACSPFFRNILRRNPHQNPLLYLKGVKYSDLQAVINFMYHGEVKVSQEELNSFLSVAEDLRVKGLTQNNSSAESRNSDSVSSSNGYDKVVPAFKKKEKLNGQERVTTSVSVKTPYCNYKSTVKEQEIQELVPVKSEPKDTQPPQNTQPIPQPVQRSFTSPNQVQNNQEIEPSDGQVIQYQDESYDDYGQYGEDVSYEETGFSANSGAKGTLFHYILLFYTVLYS